MKLKHLFSIILMIVLISCSSDDKKSTGCESDFGFLKVNVPTTEFSTVVKLTVSSQEAYEEIIAPNSTTVTFEVAAGSYAMKVQRFNSEGQSETNPIIRSVVITPCETTEETINFPS